MIEMDRLASLRRLRGLVLHHRRHPSKHPRRLVLRIARRTDTSTPGVCRWCGGPAATITLTWHMYCLDAYRVASGQRPAELRVTMCEGCGGAAQEIDHRLAINVARALGPDALRRVFTQENLRFLCRECHRRKTRLDRCLAAFVRDCSMDWRTELNAWERNREWAEALLTPFGLGFDRRNSDRTDIQSAA